MLISVQAKDIRVAAHSLCLVPPAGCEVSVLESAMHELQAEMHSKRQDAYEQEDRLGTDNPPVFATVQVGSRHVVCQLGDLCTSCAQVVRLVLLADLLCLPRQDEYSLCWHAQSCSCLGQPSLFSASHDTQRAPAGTCLLPLQHYSVNACH